MSITKPTKPARRPAAPKSPEEIREEFLTRRKTVGPVNIEPLSVALLWVLESLNHPLIGGMKLKVDADGKPVPQIIDGKPALDPVTNAPLFLIEPLSMRDTARAIFVFHDAAAAGEVLSNSLAAFDAEASALASKIAPEWIVPISEAIFTEMRKEDEGNS